MRRRDVIATAGAAVALPAAVRGQAPARPVIGFLRNTGAAGNDDIIGAFRQGLADAGFADGRDVAIEFRGAENRPERLPGLAADLVERRVAVIVVNAGAAAAAKAATTTIPIVFVAGEDPVRLGLVANLARPAGNLTGIVFNDGDLSAKRFGMAHEMTPRLATVAVLIDSNLPEGAVELKVVEEAARATGRRILAARAATGPEIDAAFESFARAGAQSVLIGVGSMFASRRDQLVSLSVRHRLPAIFPQRQYAVAGGMISYGASQPDAYRRAGGYVARILRGAKPADLPVELPTKYELVINQRAAKSIGFDVPPSLLAIADEVIE